MKKIIICFCLSLSLLLQSCIWRTNDDDIRINPDNYKPVTMDRPAFENAVQGGTFQTIANPGKIYIKDELMFISDVNKGFGVYNYSDPANPLPIGYIKIPGATDIAVRNNNIYINQAVDLVALQYHPASNTLTVISRNRNVFPQKLSPRGSVATILPNQIVIDWTL